jgi:hypothetical protein
MTEEDEAPMMSILLTFKTGLRFWVDPWRLSFIGSNGIASEKMG